MMEDAENGLIDYIITKSISRFARNTLECLSYVRHLREMGVFVYFEKSGWTRVAAPLRCYSPSCRRCTGGEPEHIREHKVESAKAVRRG